MANGNTAEEGWLPAGKFTEGFGDIFKAPDNSVLIHACNCLGSWGGGVALRMKQLYPHAHSVYQSRLRDITSGRCRSAHDALAQCILVPPQPGDAPRKHWLACLHTSIGHGRNVDPADSILEATQCAFGDFYTQVDDHQKAVAKGKKLPKMGRIFSVKLNSGLFGVPWEDTRKMINYWPIDVEVLDLPPPNQPQKPQATRKDTGRKKSDEAAELKKGTAKKDAITEKKKQQPAPAVEETNPRKRKSDEKDPKEKKGSSEKRQKKKDVKGKHAV
ncbi:hypothetical protein L228DRAFT_244910 [Xylona heveae TC161]|uniref:Uncharacterized protein n=1 Tax=Xylona heveae (strain CBS 132557 / TC161) TaxID=1328760 RepID=A0A165HWZ1_XYLHT|nr:hypothetical protein L228DRAFT_244910 [Xylona heveae TC161]KZF24042.1 hypothetical protein L228DRAFT_244910 [Xylona heveae TC161]